MEYECKLVSARTLTKGLLNMQRPLCTTCVNRTCTNPIVDKKLSIMGVIHTSRMFQSCDRFFFVVQCDGYMGANDEV